MSNNSSLTLTLDREQKRQFLQLLEECKKLGATEQQLYPISNILSISGTKDTDEYWEYVSRFHSFD